MGSVAAQSAAIAAVSQYAERVRPGVARMAAVAAALGLDGAEERYALCEPSYLRVA
jgi:hypothetical protein